MPNASRTRTKLSKRTTHRMLAATALIASASLALTGCSSGDTESADSGTKAAAGEYNGPDVTITFWNGWTGGAAPKIVPKLVEQFNSEHKNITVKNVVMSWGDIASKMPLAVKGGNGPDLAVAHGDDIATYAAQGLILPTDDIISALGYSESDFPDGVFAAGNYASKQYNIPWSVTPIGLYINQDVLTAAGIDPNTAPTDKESYFAALDALKAAGIQGDWVDGYVFTGVFQFKSLLWQFGGDLYNDDVSKAAFNSEAGVNALTFMTDLIANGYSPKDVAADGNSNALVGGKTAFNWNGVWNTTNEALQKVKWTAAPVPQIGTEKAVWSSSTHWIFLNNKGQDKNKTDAAAVFVKWMNDNSEGWAETGELPANNAIRNAPSLLETYPQLAPFIEELDYAHYETAAPGITSAEAEIATAVNEAVLGKKTPEQALSDAATKVDKLLAQNKSQYGY